MSRSTKRLSPSVATIAHSRTSPPQTARATHYSASKARRSARRGAGDARSGTAPTTVGSSTSATLSLDLKNGWVVESPDGGQLCSLQHKAQVTRDHSAVDVTVRTEAGEDVLAVMRPNGHAAITVTVSVGDTIIATVHKVEDNSPGMRGDRERSVWEARVAAGVDLSFVSLAYLFLSYFMKECVLTVAPRSW